MFNAVRLSFRDIFKSKKIYLLVNVWIFAFSLFVTSIISSILPEEDNRSQYNYYYTSKINLDEVIDIFNQVQYTSNVYLWKTGLNGTGKVFFGNTGLKQHSKNAKFKDNSITLNNQTYELVEYDFSKLGPDYEWVDYILNYEKGLAQYINIEDFLSALKIEKDQLLQIHSQLDSAGITFVINNLNNNFVYNYLSFLIVSMLITAILTTILMNRYLMKNRLIDYKVHLLNGSKLSDIILRNVLYFLPMLILQILAVIAISKGKIWIIESMIMLGSVLFNILMIIFISMIYFLSLSKQLKIQVR